MNFNMSHKFEFSKRYRLIKKLEFRHYNKVDCGIFKKNVEDGKHDIKLPIGLELTYNGYTGMVYLFSTDNGIHFQFDCSEKEIMECMEKI